MTNETKHTPTPWVPAETNGRIYIRPQGHTVGTAAVAEVTKTNKPYSEYKENAAFMVRACNSHEALIEALEAIINDCEDFNAGAGRMENMSAGDLLEGFRDAALKALAAGKAVW